MKKKELMLRIGVYIIITVILTVILSIVFSKTSDKRNQDVAIEQSDVLPSTVEETETREDIIARLVSDVNSGKAGNGNARKEYLGEYYDEVQAIIDEKYKTIIKQEKTSGNTITVEQNVTGNVIYGSMTGYGADCKGCSGTTASGYNVKNTIYYNDATYGQVRILAAPKNIPMYSVIKVSGVKGMEPFYAIVLDRGGAINGTLFDLLCESESYANKYIGRQKNIQYEIVRSGK